MFRELCAYDSELSQLTEELRNSKRATDAIRSAKFSSAFTPSEEKLRSLYDEATTYQDELIDKMELRLKEVLAHIIACKIVDDIWEGK